jgi:predicted TIM-barrel fold metal-dependent hydrolase
MLTDASAVASSVLIPAIDAHHHVWNPDGGEYPWMVGPVLPIRRVFTA